MRIELKAVCQETLGELPGGSYEVPEQCSALTALEHCLSCHGKEIERERLSGLLFMRNGRHIPSDTCLTEGDRLTVLRPMYGG